MGVSIDSQPKVKITLFYKRLTIKVSLVQSFFKDLFTNSIFETKKNT